MSEEDQGADKNRKDVGNERGSFGGFLLRAMHPATDEGKTLAEFAKHFTAIAAATSLAFVVVAYLLSLIGHIPATGWVAAGATLLFLGQMFILYCSLVNLFYAMFAGRKQNFEDLPGFRNVGQEKHLIRSVSQFGITALLVALTTVTVSGVHAISGPSSSDFGLTLVFAAWLSASCAALFVWPFFTLATALVSLSNQYYGFRGEFYAKFNPSHKPSESWIP